MGLLHKIRRRHHVRSFCVQSTCKCGWSVLARRKTGPWMRWLRQQERAHADGAL